MQADAIFKHLFSLIVAATRLDICYAQIGKWLLHKSILTWGLIALNLGLANFMLSLVSG